MYNVHPCPKYLTFSVFFNDLDILHARKIFRNILTVFFFINDFDILHAWKTFRTMYIWVCSHMFLSLWTVGFSQKVGYALLNKGICKRFFGIFPTRSCINWVLVENTESARFPFMSGYMIFVYSYPFGKHRITLHENVNKVKYLKLIGKKYLILKKHVN